MLGGVRTSVRMLGVKRVNAGLVLLTKRIGQEDSSHEIYRFEELYHELNAKTPGTEYFDNLTELILKADRKRDRILNGTTNFFSGGKVVRIL